MQNALEGIRVIDLTHHTGAPYCTMLMADFGAEVIKIERPGTGDFMRRVKRVFWGQNRNKKSVTLDMSNPAGRKVLYKLVETGDVVVENFRPGVVKRLGVDYDTLKQINKGLVYCSVSAFGQEGPYSSKPGLGPIAQGMAGMTNLTGYPDRPPVLLPMAVADFSSGMLAFGGILMALLFQRLTGIGQKVEASLLDSAVSVQQPEINGYLIDGTIPQRSGRFTERACPDGIFQTKDSYIVLLIQTENQWLKLCSILGNEDLAKDTRFESNNSRVKHKEELIPILEGILITKPSQEWLKRLEEQDILCGPINTIDQVVSDPQVIKNDMIVSAKGPDNTGHRLVGVPIKMSQTPGKVRSAAPALGQDTDEILSKLGYSLEQLQNMRRENIV